MDRVRRVARSAAMRTALAEALSLLGPALTAGFVAAGLLVAADRLLALGLTAWAVTAAPVAIAAGAALAVAMSRRPSDAGAAGRIDRALGLRDRLSSAIELTDDEATRGDAFVRWAAEDAESAAAGVDVGKAIPLKLDGWWAVWPAAGAVVVAAAVMAPTVDLFGRAEERARLATEASRREDAATQIADAAERARETLAGAEPEAAARATSEQMKALEELEEQLASGRVGPDEARSRAAASLQQIAAGADEEAASLERDLRAMDERLARLDPSEQAAPMGEELAEALRRGEFERAAELMEELSRSSGEGAMDPEEREALARDLERLAQQLEAAGEGAPLEQQSAPASEPGVDEQRVEDLQDQGLSKEEAERLAAMSDERALREELQDNGVAPEVADRLAEQIARENQERAAEEQARERSEELSDALRDAADDVREPPPPPPPPPEAPPQESTPPAPPTETDPSKAPPPSPPEQGQEGASEEQRQPGESERPQEEQGAEDSPAPKPGEGGEQRQGQPQQQEQQGQGEGREDQPRPEGGEQPNAPEGSESGEQQQPQEQGEGAPESREEPGESRPGSSEAPQNEQGPPSGGGRPQEMQEDSSAPGEGGEPPPGAERARRALEQMERERRQAEGRRGDAERMRREAQRLMENASPEQREQAQRWAQHEAQESSDGPPSGGVGEGGEGVRSGEGPGQRPFGTETVDARRGSTEKGRVAAEWVDPNAPAPAGGGVEGAKSAERVREAARSAERAMEEQAVSPRYNRVVREFFRRRLEAAESAPAGPAPAPAQDVERGGAPPAEKDPG